MRKTARTTLALAISIVFVIMLIVSCEEQNVSNTKSDVRKSRLIATENRQLKQQLVRRDKKIERQKELLAKRSHEIKILREQTQETLKKRVDSVLVAVLELNAELQEENKKLKAQIEELKKELEEVKNR